MWKSFGTEGCKPVIGSEAAGDAPSLAEGPGDSEACKRVKKKKNIYRGRSDLKQTINEYNREMTV